MRCNRAEDSSWIAHTEAGARRRAARSAALGPAEQSREGLTCQDSEACLHSSPKQHKIDSRAAHASSKGGLVPRLSPNTDDDTISTIKRLPPTAACKTPRTLLRSVAEEDAPSADAQPEPASTTEYTLEEYESRRQRKPQQRKTPSAARVCVADAPCAADTPPPPPSATGAQEARGAAEHQGCVLTLRPRREEHLRRARDRDDRPTAPPPPPPPPPL